MHNYNMDHPCGHDYRFRMAKHINAQRQAEARALDRALQFRGERLRLKAPKRKPKRKGHHGWRQNALAR